MRYLQQNYYEGKIELDLKDKKILHLLSLNARLPCTVIAKRVGLSRDAVNYRIKSLIKKGVIQGYRTIVNINKLGYDAYHIFLQLNQPLLEIENLLIKKLENYPFVRAIIKFSGKYDLQLATVAKNIKEFDSILDTVINDCSKYLQDYEIMIITKDYTSKVFPKSFLKTNDKIITVKKQLLVKKTDDKDKKILRIISNNANMPLYKIAKNIKLSPDAVNYRIKNMINEKIILKFVPVINYTALSYSIYAVLLNIQNLTEKKEATLKQILTNNENVIWAVKTIGRYNLLLYICTKSPEDVHKTLIDLRSCFPEEIKNYETLIAYEEYKYTYFPDCMSI